MEIQQDLVHNRALHLLLSGAVLCEGDPEATSFSVGVCVDVCIALTPSFPLSPFTHLSCAPPLAEVALPCLLFGLQKGHSRLANCR